MPLSALFAGPLSLPLRASLRSDQPLTRPLEEAWSKLCGFTECAVALFPGEEGEGLGPFPRRALTRRALTVGGLHAPAECAFFGRGERKNT